MEQIGKFSGPASPCDAWAGLRVCDGFRGLFIQQFTKAPDEAIPAGAHDGDAFSPIRPACPLLHELPPLCGARLEGVEFIHQPLKFNPQFLVVAETLCAQFYLGNELLDPSAITVLRVGPALSWNDLGTFGQLRMIRIRCQQAHIVIHNEVVGVIGIGCGWIGNNGLPYPHGAGVRGAVLLRSALMPEYFEHGVAFFPRALARVLMLCHQQQG